MPPPFPLASRRPNARDVTNDVSSPVEWIQEYQLDIEDAGPGRATVRCPSIGTPSAVLPRYDVGPGRFTGNKYIKCMSTAWCMEWVLTDGRRPQELKPPPQRS